MALPSILGRLWYDMKSDVSQGKLPIGMQGQGTVTEQMIERRARQITVINGRTEESE
jgi:hypothetical protein